MQSIYSKIQQKINTKAILILISALFNLFICHAANADTEYGPNCASSIAVTINVPSNINIATIPANSPLITPLTDWFSQGALSFTGCKAGTSTNPNYIRFNSSLAPTGKSYTENGLTYPILDLGNGIGLVISVENIGNPQPTRTPIISWGFTDVPIGIDGDFFTLYRLRFIRYSTIPSGSISIPSTVLFQQEDWYHVWANGKYSHRSFDYLSSTTITVQNASCSVNTANITVQLPNIQLKQLPSIGAISSSTPFNIGVTCPSAVNVYMTITDNSNPASTSNIITAGNGSTAQGLGVQIMRNNLPIYLGADSSMAGNTNQFFVGNILGSKTIPFTANYIRTGNVGAGQLKAFATFTMSYQ
ncbi:fimbrial protein [Aquitalea sp. ASV11]|uniref:fimbrial protein n=1 Tax=Aquitalea sp. ASV11 TaxID=2795103 RepID=UPI0018EA7E97|nr:fimbrial protein [Aquitalea sp. ASV11]